MLRCVLMLGVLTLAAPAVAEDKPVRVATDPAKAGPDFLVQGEYLGQFGTGETIGIQVVALGGGEFDAAVYFGGLPGEGAIDGEPIHAHGKTVDGVTTLSSDEGRGEIKEGKMTIFDSEGQELGVLERVIRKSPTLGMKPPEGALVLFDGTSAEQFERGRMTRENTLPAGSVSKAKLGDGRLHLEFCTPFMPTHRGQNRGNSGVYLQGRYEVQVLDSLGLPPKDNECGGLYGFHEPSDNVCFPPLSWQTYDIDFTGAKFDGDKKTSNAKLTVKLNGVTVQENAELTHESGLGAAEGPEPGPLLLQFHLCPVQFRNIWFVPAGG